jgi:uncharacterized protein with GYD domain
MAYFLYRGSYTPAAKAALIESGEDRSVHVADTMASLGGTLEAFYLAFGEHDFFLIAQFPDPQSAAAFGLAAAAGGAVSDFSTTPLLTWAEGLNAFKQAARAGYRPPGAGG